ncbi:hypothetical protein [Sphingopyxis sp.]|uniref:hypothetical protein n=1 Tax=Sphingopyxis sp. TaxID=1908224 RepID=UPI002D7662C1|nr:hypothetical protein [Sphingopyxis sp.]HET6525216.1 hypothetical protein [Sphingopyxis sp.]
MSYSIPLGELRGVVTLIAWIAVLIFVTWMISRVNERFFRLASPLVAALAVIVSVVLPIWFIIAGPNVRRVHTLPTLATVVGAFAISWIACRIFLRRRTKTHDASLFD